MLYAPMLPRVVGGFGVGLRRLSEGMVMQMKPGNRPTGLILQLAAAAVVALGSASAARAQAPAPSPKSAPAAQPAQPADLVESPSPSQVFPEGGFPTTPPSSEGGIPATAAKPGLATPHPELHSPISDYGPSGYEPREQQQAPGVPEFYRPFTGPLPAYFYRPAYYEQPVVSPRTVEEYAPPGYEARDQQLGPGTPEFILITPPLPITPEESERFVTRGIFPGSFLVPGTNTSFRLRGFVRLMGLYDFNPIGSTDSFVPNTIPVPQQSGQNYNASARMSRIATETWTPTPFFEWTVHTFVEGDFFNGPAQAAGGGGNPFRLRHAFVDFGYFRVGQQNTVFMDASTWPSVVDFQGPAGWANQRRPGARVTLPLADQLFWAGGIEQPFSDITTNGLGSNVQDIPDFATHLRYETDFGHIQIAGLLRAVSYQPTGGEVTRRTGYGMSVGTTFHPWALLIGSNPVRKDNPTALERCRIIGQYTFGWGIGRYLQDTVGQGLDGQVDPATGGFDVLYASGYILSYEQWYNEHWLSNFTYSQTLVASNGDQPGSTYVGGKYLAASLWYIPIRNLSLGVEYLWGERKNLDEERGRVNRLDALVQYNF
jgi:hypothetical protein